MSCRRSTRLATKNNTGPKNGDTDPDLVFESNTAQRFNLRTHTPHTPNLRNSQKRKRTVLSNAAVGIAEPEVCRSEEAVSTSETSNQHPQSPVQNVGLVSNNLKCNSGGLNFKNDLSLVDNDSFLLAVDKIEIDDPILTKNCASNAPKSSLRECSQDIFGDDDEILAVLPITPVDNATSGRIRKRSVSFSSKKSAVVPETKFVQEAVLPEQSLNRGATKRSGTKRSVNEKKKRKTGGGQVGATKKKSKSKFKLAFTNRKATIELANSASNELSIEDLSYMTAQEKLQLSSWGLPLPILKNYKEKGITSLFEWQLECLANGKALEGRNLLYSAPTSAGKTLVSEILMIKRVLELGRKAIMILPFVSVAREKVYSLQSIFGDAGVRVEGFMGSVNPPGGFKAVDIAICTIEKANSLINRILEEGSLADLGTLVVDELHLISDPHRGYLLELLLTKIQYMTSIKNGVSESSMNMTDDASWKPRRCHIQVVGMSATLPNLDVLAKWINAELYVTDFRPVPLMERIVIDDKIYDDKMNLVRDVNVESVPIKLLPHEDRDNIIYLTLETILNGFSVLIFCPTKPMVEKTATEIAKEFFKIGSPGGSPFPEIGEQLRAQLNGVKIKAMLDQLKQCPGGADDVLQNTVKFGIGYHHAGLTYENRDIVESAFKKGILRVIVATSTLSAGVNLPARRVIIATPVVFNGLILDVTTYRQMCGRAGRNGIDSEGESLLVCPSTLKEKGLTLFKGCMPPVKSALLGDGSLTSAMKRAFLEVIASGIASLTTDVKSYAKCTFLFHSLESGLYHSEELSASQLHKDATIDDCLKYLQEQDLIRIKHYEDDNKPDEYMPTQLGSACLASSLSPDDGIVVYKELLKFRKCMNLENELHTIYQVTPIYISDTLRNIDWNGYLAIWEQLDASEKSVATLVGVNEAFIFRCMIGACSRQNPKQLHDMAIHQRFYAALALNDLVNEKPLSDVTRKYGLNKGILQSLQQASSTFAGMITAFCGKLEWSSVELLLGQFQERLEFGVQRELCDLVRLDSLNGQRARILYDAGLKTIMELASIDPAQVEHILHRASPFKSEVHGGRGSNIWMIGKETLTETEAAQKIVRDARQYIQIELGQQGNVQFAFRNNEVLSASHTSQAKESDKLNGLKSSSSDNETSEVPEDFECKKDIHSYQKSALVINDDYSEESQLQDALETEDLFTQHKQCLENSVVKMDLDVVEDDVFEDSLPEIVMTNLSALYSKYNQGADEQKQFSIQQHVDACVVSVNKVVQCERELLKADRPTSGGVNDNEKNVSLIAKNVQHSTPFLSKGSRFTLREHENTSPVMNISNVCAKPRIILNNANLGFHESSSELQVEKSIMELSDAFIADLENEFDSVCEVLPDKIDSFKVLAKVKAKSESLRLSESDAEAMRALADDSNFESEDLFSVDECAKLGNVPKPEEIVEEMDEDLILTQADPFDTKDDNDILQEELDMFQDSSSDTESSSCMEALSVLSSPEESAELVATISDKKITAKVVQSVDSIPKSFFEDSEMIGMSLKLISTKKMSSAARMGIGARFISKKFGSSKNEEGDQPPHSVYMYAGGDTIWILRWRSFDSSIYNRGSNRKSHGKDSLKILLTTLDSYHCSLAMFESKEKIKNLLKLCGVDFLDKLPPGNRIWDPSIAQWMWEFDDEDWNISKSKLIDAYVNEADKNISNLGWDKEITEGFFAWKVMKALRDKLKVQNLWAHFTQTEMPSLIPLVLMEMNGFGLDPVRLGKLKRVLQFQSTVLELKAYQLAGRQFNLSSPKDIKQILYREIGLKQPKDKGTTKDILLKLDHELPKVIVAWRTVSNALQKVVPFQQERNLETGRVHGYYSHFTLTGRVNMTEPSLQCIPRDFDISNSYNVQEIMEIKTNCTIKFGSKLATLFQLLDNEMMDPTVLEGSMISMRDAFIPFSNEFVILAADYSQLELRILAHLSNDTKLLQTLNEGADVFTDIASEWKNLPKSKITSSIRQDTKRIVYGIIYGMSPKTLSEQMDVNEREAHRFMTDFKRTYSGVNLFLDQAVKKCKEKGHVETIGGRRRYLPLIHSSKPQESEKASRQAVNTQIQGSAADLMKHAMSQIYKSLSKKYPTSCTPIEWSSVLKAKRLSLSAETSKSLLDKYVYFPILNLHDELIFEVRRTHLPEIASAIKHEMEYCLKLRVKIPVVIRCGESWGTLETYEIT